MTTIIASGRLTDKTQTIEQMVKIFQPAVNSLYMSTDYQKLWRLVQHLINLENTSIRIPCFANNEKRVSTVGFIDYYYGNAYLRIKSMNSNTAEQDESILPLPSRKHTFIQYCQYKDLKFICTADFLKYKTRGGGILPTIDIPLLIQHGDNNWTTEKPTLPGWYLELSLIEKWPPRFRKIYLENEKMVLDTTSGGEYDQCIISKNWHTESGSLWLGPINPETFTMPAINEK